MNINPDDPKWTAYVLGELTEAERIQVEKELETSAAAREVVEEIRLTTSLLSEELAKELPAAALSVEQKREVRVAASAKPPRPWFRWAAVLGTAAAGVIVALTLWIPSQLRSRQPASELAAPLTAVNSAPVESQSVSKDIKAGAIVPHNREKLEVEQQQGQQGQIAGQPMAPPAPASVLGGAGGGVSELRQVLGFADKKTLAAPTAAAEATADRVDRPRLNTEAYDYISDNPFISVAQDPRATFSIDVDTASYANMRRFLSMNQLPPKDSVRIEEMVNYFSYDYPSPSGRHPIGVYPEVASAPWQPDHRLVRIGVKAKDIDVSKRPPSNLVFLIDVSGSMATPEKLPLLKSAMKLMVDRLTEADHVAIVTYAGISGLQLPSTPGDRKQTINAAIDQLGAGGSTNGASGIVMAYDTAISHFIGGGINRVILATDGDFNVGVTNQGDLTRLIEDKAKSKVFLSVLGFGMGNYKDSTLEKLADKGNGNYAYIDTLNEARKVLVEEMSGTLLTVAKDVKIQVEFNPAEVNAYRLIGYENRALRHEDFNNDQKDAGDMGAGQTVTALFEIVPRGVDAQVTALDRLKYQPQPLANAVNRAPRGELLNVNIRYKQPEENTSQAFETPVVDRQTAFNNATTDFRFAASVAGFGMILRDSPYKAQATLDNVLDIAERSKGTDRNGYRGEFVELVKKTRSLR